MPIDHPDQAPIGSIVRMDDDFLARQRETAIDYFRRYGEDTYYITCPYGRAVNIDPPPPGMWPTDTAVWYVRMEQQVVNLLTGERVRNHREWVRADLLEVCAPNVQEEESTRGTTTGQSTRGMSTSGSETEGYPGTWNMDLIEQHLGSRYGTWRWVNRPERTSTVSDWEYLLLDDVNTTYTVTDWNANVTNTS